MWIRFWRTLQFLHQKDASWKRVNVIFSNHQTLSYEYNHRLHFFANSYDTQFTSIFPSFFHLITLIWYTHIDHLFQKNKTNGRSVSATLTLKWENSFFFPAKGKYCFKCSTLCKNSSLTCLHVIKSHHFCVFFFLVFIFFVSKNIDNCHRNQILFFFSSIHIFFSLKNWVLRLEIVRVSTCLWKKSSNRSTKFFYE